MKKGRKADKIAASLGGLFNPAPSDIDPESISFDGTNAKIFDYDEEGLDLPEEGFGKSLLRKQAADLTPKVKGKSNKYSGKSVSRLAAFSHLQGSEEEEEEESEGEEEEEESDEEMSEEEEEEEDEEGDSMMMGEEESEEESEEDSEEESEEEEEDDGMGKLGEMFFHQKKITDADLLQQQLEQELNQKEEEKVEEEEEEDAITLLSRRREEEKEKGEQVKQQCALSDHFLGVRIKQQKALSLANRLPPFSSHQAFITHDQETAKVKGKGKEEKGKGEAGAILTSAQEVLLDVTKELLGVQKSLLQYEETSIAPFLKGGEGEDEEEVSVGKKRGRKGMSQQARKRRRLAAEGEGEEGEEEVEEKEVVSGEDLEELWAEVEGWQKKLEGAQEEVIDTWQRKTQIFSAVTQNKYKTINTNINDQITTALKDNNHLLLKSRVRREKGKQLGLRMAPEEKHNPEIFDDSDFYTQLLRQLVTATTADSDDPMAMSRAYLKQKEGQVKIRKNVDRKASKCRRIRYNTHEKLVNFMAPVMGEVGDEGEEGGTIPRGLYTNLFR